MAAADPSTPPTIAFGRLYEYAKGRDPARDPEVARAIGSEVSVWRQFRAIAVRLGSFGEAAAAAATHLSDRDGIGWRIQLKPYRAKPGQTYSRCIDLDTTEGLVTDARMRIGRPYAPRPARAAFVATCFELHEGKIQKVLLEDVRQLSCRPAARSRPQAVS